MAPAVGFLAQIAAARGLTYEPDADERWLRAWEPYATLKTPTGYSHALHATGSSGSVTIARFSVTMEVPPEASAANAAGEAEASSWICLVQDVGIDAALAVTSDPGRVFSESLDLVTMPRQRSGDPIFDRVFASFASSAEELQRGLTPSLRKLLFSWGVPVHVELRKGAFVLAPVSLPFDPNGVSWLADAVHYFGAKAKKRTP